MEDRRFRRAYTFKNGGHVLDDIQLIDDGIILRYEAHLTDLEVKGFCADNGIDSFWSERDIDDIVAAETRRLSGLTAVDALGYDPSSPGGEFALDLSDQGIALLPTISSTVVYPSESMKEKIMRHIDVASWNERLMDAFAPIFANYQNTSMYGAFTGVPFIDQHVHNFGRYAWEGDEKADLAYEVNVDEIHFAEMFRKIEFSGNETHLEVYAMTLAAIRWLEGWAQDLERAIRPNSAIMNRLILRLPEGERGLEGYNLSFGYDIDEEHLRDYLTERVSQARCARR